MHLWHSRPAHRRRVNGSRRSLIAIFALIASALSVGAVVPLVANAAGPQAFGMSMVPETGRFMISGNEPGAPLGDPTSVSGSYDPSTGELSNVSFATPEVHIVQHVTVPQELDVFIDQQLIPLAPGTGHLDENGDMTLDLTFKLHVKIKASIATGDCWSEPINVQLKSTAPYNTDTDQVNLKAEGFNIPNLQTTSTCASIITNNAGAQFAGSNNRLELTLQGDLTAALNESTTTLALSNPGPVTQGTSTTMTATVAPAEATGSVDFYTGESYLGSSPINASGVATLAKALPSGTHQITARYSGNATYAGSSSDPIEFVVQAKPDFGVGFPPILVPGAAAQEFDLTVTNPSDGVPANLRVDFSIAQAPGDSAVGGLNVTPSNLSMEYQDGNGDWVPVGLTQGATTFSAMTASYGTLNGFALAPGETREVPFRMAVAVGTPKRTLTTTASLKQVNPETGAPVGANVAQIIGTSIIPSGTRVDPGAVTLSPLGGGVNPGDQVTRGYYLAVKGLIAPAANVAGQPVNPAPVGVGELLVDGVPTPTVSMQEGVEPSGLRVPIVTGTGITPGSGGFVREFLDTKNLTAGTHTVQLRYFGDSNYKDAFSNVVTFTVTPAWGKLYTCTFAPLAGGVYKVPAMVNGIATLPSAVASGTTVSFADAEIKLGDSPFPAASSQQVLGPQIRDITATLAPGGTASKIGGSTVTQPSATQNDVRFGFTGMTGNALIVGEPGDRVDVTIERLDFRTGGFAIPGFCESTGDPARLGSVIVAGTKLVVTPGGISRVGDQVTLAVNVGPATGGQVEFFDGEDSLGVVPVTAGKAVLVTGDLAGGTHQLVARHSGGSVNINGVNVSVGANYSNTVEKLIQSATTTSTAATNAQFLTGPATLKAVVETSPASSTAPTGNVQFKVDGNPVGSPVALRDGQAQLVSTFPAGAHTVTASYIGTDAFAASDSAPTTFTIGKFVTSMGVAPVEGSNVGLYFRSTAFKATLTSPAGPVAGKTVSFKVGPNPACSAVTDASGVAICTGQVPSLTATLKKAYTATFAGDATATASSGTAALVR
ncbi:Ig-like domain repeat protein [Nocardioides marmoriginsengisoli]|uniref:Ig-like domain repeat protein n=1 Tax=Nocardioides marmoriginsengisoli TaxID=661483 RepID=A0A3N0CFU2_9ACTN|nr:Ig-like domain-containing protein [Nocardioides marmoriginsengisoli]RNL62324.1 Ig-like domain repeat protein [Nocardioides marmoriginsengisoli]